MACLEAPWTPIPYVSIPESMSLRVGEEKAALTQRKLLASEEDWRRFACHLSLFVD